MLVLGLFIAIVATLICVAVGFSFICVAAFLGKPSNREINTGIRSAGANLPVFSPTDGFVVPLEMALDAAAGAGVLKPGLAVRTRSGSVFAPFDATVVATFPVERDIVLRHAEGLNIRIRVGANLNTVDRHMLNLKVIAGQQVNAGHLLVRFDLEAMTAAVHDITTSVVIENNDVFPHLELVTTGWVRQGEALFTARRA